MSDFDDNPFRAPESDLRMEGVLSGTKKDLRSVAQYQRVIMLCILAYLMVFPLRLLLPPEAVLVAAVVFVAALVTGTVFVFLLSAKGLRDAARDLIRPDRVDSLRGPPGIAQYQRQGHQRADSEWYQDRISGCESRGHSMTMPGR